MRTAILCLAILFTGCAPVPPGDVVGGEATWAFDGYPERQAAVYTCLVENGELLVSASSAADGPVGPMGTRISVRLAGPVDAAPEWDGEIVHAWHVHPLGTEFGDYRLRHLEGCTAHVGTGAGTWIVDLDCPNGSAEIVVTGCER